MSRSYWSPAFTCYHNPGEIFNTDICGGLPAAIIQTLMQSSLQEIELLPALPKSWPNGKITGIRARGGVTLDIEWRDDTLQCVALCSNNTRKAKLNCGPDLAEVELAEGETVVLNGALKVV